MKSKNSPDSNIERFPCLAYSVQITVLMLATAAGCRDTVEPQPQKAEVTEAIPGVSQAIKDLWNEIEQMAKPDANNHYFESDIRKVKSLLDKIHQGLHDELTLDDVCPSERRAQVMRDIFSGYFDEIDEHWSSDSDFYTLEAFQELVAISGLPRNVIVADEKVQEAATNIAQLVMRRVELQSQGRTINYFRGGWSTKEMDPETEKRNYHFLTRARANFMHIDSLVNNLGFSREQLGVSQEEIVRIIVPRLTDAWQRLKDDINNKEDVPGGISVRTYPLVQDFDWALHETGTDRSEIVSQEEFEAVMGQYADHLLPLMPPQMNFQPADSASIQETWEYLEKTLSNK